MIACVFESSRGCRPRDPMTIEGCDVGEYDFQVCAKQAYFAVNSLYLTNLIKEMPFDEPEDIRDLIHTLIEEIDLDDLNFQSAEKDHIRVQYLDYMLGIEVVLGV